MEQAKATINGPTQICPRGTYTYTISGLPWDVDFCKWVVSYQGPNGTPSIGPTVFHGNSFTINFNSPDVGTAWIKVEVYTHFQGPSWTYVEFYQVNRTLPVPVSPGVVIACGPNESITVSSSPYIPYNPGNPSNTASCLFHCAYTYSAPSNWLFTHPGNGSQSNSVTFSTDQITLTSPSSVSNGNAGTITVSALFSRCDYSVNTQNYGSIWVGTPTLSNPTVNGAPSQTPNYINGSAFLVIGDQGATGISWQIDGGSGYIQPNYNSCNASTSNFLLVRATTTNRCGQGQSHSFYLQNSNYSGYRVYPNPAKSVVKVEFDDAKYAEDLVQGIAILDEEGKPVKAFDIESAKTSKYFQSRKFVEFDISKLRRGRYYFQINIGGNLKASQLFLE